VPANIRSIHIRDVAGENIGRGSGPVVFENPSAFFFYAGGV
jgi:hypothetical protein